MSASTVRQGLAFGDVFPRFPNAIVLGVSNPRTGRTRINPPAELRLEAGDALVRTLSTAPAQGRGRVGQEHTSLSTAPARRGVLHTCSQLPIHRSCVFPEAGKMLAAPVQDPQV